MDYSLYQNNLAITGSFKVKRLVTFLWKKDWIRLDESNKIKTNWDTNKLISAFE